jgi:PilZ domain
MVEKRQAPRRGVKEVAKIVLEAQGKVESCVVLDISDTGARLLVNSVSGLPKSFLLFRKADKFLREATVVRRELKSVGVRFEPPLDFESARVQALRKYRDLAPLFLR